MVTDVCLYYRARLTPDLELLKDETTEVDLVGPTLQSLKKLLDKVPEAQSEKVKYERMVHGILSACLVNVDDMRSVPSFSH